jgi:hypothetical protein
MFTTNTTVDLSGDAMDATDQANRATDRADQEGTGDAHQVAAESHTDAAQMHANAAPERDGQASLAHEQMAANHRSLARQHSENADWFFDHDDGDNDGGDNDDGNPPVQNTWLQKLASVPPRRPTRGSRPQLVTNASYGSDAIQRIVRDLVGTAPDAPSRIVSNCACRTRQEDLLIAPTLSDVLHPVANEPQTNEFNRAGVVAGRNAGDGLPPLTINFQAGDPAFDRGTGKAITGGKGPYPKGPRSSTPDFGQGDTGKYPSNGVKSAEEHSVAWAMADSEPPARGRDAGGDVASYPFRGTKQAQASADAAGDRQDDEGALVGRGAGTRGPRGSRGRQAKLSGGYGPDAFDAPPVVDKTDGQRGQFHTAGSPNGPVYASDFFAGNRPLPTEKYTVTQADREAESRRQFGNQPVMNEDELVLPPSPDWAEWSKTWPKTGRLR